MKEFSTPSANTESFEEGKAVAWAENNGWIVRKMQYIGRRGCPDRFFFGYGQIIMIEFKRLDTGVTASVPSTTLDSFEIRGSTDGNTFTFYINDVLVATITTNLLPVTSRLGFGYNFIRSAGTAALNAASWDYLMFEQDLPSRT